MPLILNESKHFLVVLLPFLDTCKRRVDNMTYPQSMQASTQQIRPQSEISDSYPIDCQVVQSN